MYFQISNWFVFLLVSYCALLSSISGDTLRPSRETAESEIDWDLARQNRITQQILQHYLERKLFPQLKRPDSKLPTASEILNRERKNYDYDKINTKLNATKKRYQEVLQSVESERITSVYDNIDRAEDLLQLVYEGALL